MKSPAYPHTIPEEEAMPLDMTLLDLVNAVSVQAGSEAEVIATVVHLVNSGRVRLCGNFKDARFDLPKLAVGHDTA